MMTWDPTRRREPVVVELDSSRDEDGHAHGSVTLSPWKTRERLAYQDRSAAAVRMVMVEGEDGQETQVRRVDMSTLELIHLGLTVTACSGFPVQYGDDGRPEPFDFANRRHVEELDADVFLEVKAEALRVQPLPTAGVRKPTDRKPAAPPPGVTAETAADFDTGEDEDSEDPSPTPSTPAARRRRS